MKPFPFQITPRTEDEQYMLQALRLAWQAYLAREVPVGAVIVFEGRVIAKGFNQVEMLKDATAHAEMLALTQASAALDNWRLKGATLYCTMEPCGMCAGAMALSRIDRLVWGAKDFRHGANGSLYDFFSIKHPTHTIDVIPSVLAEPASELLKMFFYKRREENGSKNG